MKGLEQFTQELLDGGHCVPRCSLSAHQQTQKISVECMLTTGNQRHATWSYLPRFTYQFAKMKKKKKDNALRWQEREEMGTRVLMVRV